PYCSYCAAWHGAWIPYWRIPRRRRKPRIWGALRRRILRRPRRVLAWWLLWRARTLWELLSLRLGLSVLRLWMGCMGIQHRLWLAVFVFAGVPLLVWLSRRSHRSNPASRLFSLRLSLPVSVRRE